MISQLLSRYRLEHELALTFQCSCVRDCLGVEWVSKLPMLWGDALSKCTAAQDAAVTCTWYLEPLRERHFRAPVRHINC